MGNTKLKACIELRSKSVKAGDSIIGSVQVPVPETVSDFSASVSLIQLESVTFLAGGEADWHKNHSKNLISTQILKRTATQISGLYSYPFEINTPNSLSGSINIHNTNFTVFIRYDLICEIQTKNLNSVTSQPVHIRQLIASNKPQNASNSSNLKILKAFPKGKSEVHVELAKLCYDIGEIVSMQVAIDNSSSDIKAKAIEVNLFRLIKFEYSNNLNEERLQKVFTYKYPVTVPKSSQLFNFKTFSFAFPLNLKEKYRKGGGTSIGKIIESKYFFEVCVKFSKLSNEIKTSVPVVIFNDAGIEDNDSLKTID